MKSSWFDQVSSRPPSFKEQFTLEEREKKAKSIRMREIEGSFIPALV